MDDLNLSLTQQLQIIMKDVPSGSKSKDEDQDGEKCQIETEGDHYQEVSNTNSTEKEDYGLVDEKDQIQPEDDPVSELMDRVVKAVNVARQDNFPYLQHPGKIIYLKKRGEEEARGDDDVGDRHVALTEDSLRVPQHLPLLASMLTDHRDHKYRLAVRSLQSHGSGEGLGFKGLKEVLN